MKMFGRLGAPKNKMKPIPVVGGCIKEDNRVIRKEEGGSQRANQTELMTRVQREGRRDEYLTLPPDSKPHNLHVHTMIEEEEENLPCETVV